MKSLYLLLPLCLLVACSEQDKESPDIAAERRTSVTLAQPSQQDINYVLTALGSVESIHSPTISAETGGQIISIDVSEGAAVSTGQLLASIDNTLHQIEAAKAEAEVARASVVLENQRKEVVRLKRLEKSQSVSRDQLEDQETQLAMLQAQRDIAAKQWEQARYMESKTRVLAPQSGLIARRHVSLGDYVSLGTPLFDLVSVERLKARLSFPEHDAASITIGKEVKLMSPAAPGVTALGQVTGINPQINIHNRAMEVTVEFNNPGGWLPGASVDAVVIIEQRKGALTLPATSVVTRSGEEVIFILDGGRARQQPVTLGWREIDWVEITSGVQAEDRVVVIGASLISGGSLLAERP
jgi:RND family efflux transporter MFP subunit